MKQVIRCRECEHAELRRGNNNPGRYYCRHPKAGTIFEYTPHAMICRTARHSDEITIKTSPKWCPRKERGKDDGKKG